MRWSEEAEKAIGKVPFFVRKKVRGQIEKEAARAGAGQVTIEHVETCRRRFLAGGQMEKEARGFQIETCFGPGGCENRAVESDRLIAELENLLSRRDLAGFLKERVGGPLKFHHEFRVSVSDCPNACSRPQIIDFGIIGARSPEISNEPCAGCGACVQVCREGAVALEEAKTTPVVDCGEAAIVGDCRPTVDSEKCVRCGKCIGACPSGALAEGARGYRILVGGKLGRHPRLGTELKGIYSMREVLEIFECCLDLYFENNRSGERFGDILNRVGPGTLCGR